MFIHESVSIPLIKSLLHHLPVWCVSRWMIRTIVSGNLQNVFSSNWVTFHVQKVVINTNWAFLSLYCFILIPWLKGKFVLPCTGIDVLQVKSHFPSPLKASSSSSSFLFIPVMKKDSIWDSPLSSSSQVQSRMRWWWFREVLLFFLLLFVSLFGPQHVPPDTGLTQNEEDATLQKP